MAKKSQIKKSKLTPEDKGQKEKAFEAVKPEITPHPTPSPEKLAGLGVRPEKKKRYRRTKAELDEEKGQLVETANPLLSPILKIFFSAWARGVDDKRIELTNNEANDLALPITQLMEYYLPAIPQIYFAWANLVIQTSTIINLRMTIIKEIRDKNANTKQRKQGDTSSGQEGVGQEFPSEIKPQRV